MVVATAVVELDNNYIQTNCSRIPNKKKKKTTHTDRTTSVGCDEESSRLDLPSQNFEKSKKRMLRLSTFVLIPRLELFVSQLSSLS